MVRLIQLTKGAYTYTVADGWSEFINSVKGVYVNVDTQGYVTWVDKGSEEANKAAAKTFAQLALAYAKTHTSSITAVSPTETNGSTVKFTELNLGYYLVDSSVGALCSLTTTQPSAEAWEKNSEPKVEKEVLENSDNKYHEKNNDYIGKTIYFKTTVTAGDGAEGYVLYDDMSAGLTFNSGSIKVYVMEDNEEVLVSSDNYTVTEGNGHTFKIEFKDTFTSTLVAGDVIIVKYDAVLNENAVIGSEGNPNTTYLTYGDKTDSTNRTPDDTTKTYTYRFDLVKTDSDNKLLPGATFKLLDAKKNVIKLVFVSEGVYRVAGDDEEGIEEITAGKITIKGLDNGTYYVEEVTPPAGYNKLATPQEFVIKDANLDASMSEDVWTAGGVHVINYTGDELPTTGGMGTVLFITIGSLMVLGFGVLLVTKLRMSKMSA